FEELAADRLLAREVLVLDELLRDRRAALHGAAVRDVGPERARHAADVDAAMLVEALVLDRDDRALQPRRDRVRPDDDARLVAAQDGEHGVAVRRVDIGVRLRPLVRRVELRDLCSDRGQETEGERHGAQRPKDKKEGEESELPDAPPLGTAPISTEERQSGGSLALPWTRSATPSTSCRRTGSCRSYSSAGLCGANLASIPHTLASLSGS